jgi:hypothetical protein
MDMKQVKEKANSLDLKPGKLRKADLLRAIKTVKIHGLAKDPNEHT